jgi:hypothetical protein
MPEYGQTAFNQLIIISHSVPLKFSKKILFPGGETGQDARNYSHRWKNFTISGNNYPLLKR